MDKTMKKIHTIFHLALSRRYFRKLMLIRFFANADL